MKHEQAQVTEGVAKGEVFAVTRVGLVGAEVVELLVEACRFGMQFALGRQFGLHVDHAAHGVAAVLGREGAVDDLRRFELVGRHQAPARRARPAGLKQRVQRHAVGKDHGARGLEHVGATHGHRAVRVADVALANHHARLVLEDVFDRGGIDLLGLFCADEDRRAGEVCGGVGCAGHHHVGQARRPCFGRDTVGSHRRRTEGGEDGRGDGVEAEAWGGRADGHEQISGVVATSASGPKAPGLYGHPGLENRACDDVSQRRSCKPPGRKKLTGWVLTSRRSSRAVFHYA